MVLQFAIDFYLLFANGTNMQENNKDTEACLLLLCIVSGCRWLAQLWQCSRRMGVVGIVLWIPYFLCVQYCGLLRAPLSLYYNGPTSWQCSQAYMCDPVRVHVIILFGDCYVSLLCPMYWAVPHHSAGAQHRFTCVGGGNIETSDRFIHWHNIVPKIIELLVHKGG